MVTPHDTAPIHLVVMGVSGTGKTSLAEALTQEFGLTFAEGDDLHPASNIDKMSAGIPLTDEDRAPWLNLIASWMTEQAQAGNNTIVTCSALKKSYRDTLRTAQGSVVFVHLAGDKETIAQRMQLRTDHFMPVSLLDSQFATLEHLEKTEQGIVVDVAGSKSEVAQAAIDGIRALNLF